MKAILERALSAPVGLRMGLDMRLEVEVQGVVYKLVPDYTLSLAPLGNESADWWVVNGRIFIRTPDGWVQGFDVLP